LDNGITGSEKKIELGVGFFTVGVAKLATKITARFVDVPPEARTAISSLKEAECSVYQFRQRRQSLASILADADKSMAGHGYERLVGVIQENQLVAVYIPKKMKSARDLKASVLVLNDKQLVCAT